MTDDRARVLPLKARAARRSAASDAGPITEDSAALRFAELHRGRLRFCHDHGAWFVWDGAIWRRNAIGIAFQWARELARELTATEPDKVRFIASKAAFAASVERFARSDPAFAVTAQTWDGDPWLLGTPSGTVDLRTGLLSPADPGDGITKSAAVAPAARTDCPVWTRFLADSTGDDAELIRFLQQWCGYGLTGDTREHALVFVFGDGGNGKSVFIRAVTSIMASYAAVASMDTFIASHGDRHSTDLAMLRGARLVTASETEEGRQWAESRIKQMTGGDAVSARFMRQDFFTFQPAFKLTIVGNHKPGLRSIDAAARRRFNLVPFIRTPAKVDPELSNKLQAEAPGILRWMIDGCLDWQRNGLLRPASVVAATEHYFEGQDTLAAWMSEECDVEPGNKRLSQASAHLFAAWQTYSKNAGEDPGTKKAFADQLTRRGMEAARGHGGIRLYRGIQLRPTIRQGDAGDGL